MKVNENENAGDDRGGGGEGEGEEGCESQAFAIASVSCTRRLFRISSPFSIL